MKILTLEHLAPYLPYGLKIYDGEYQRLLTFHHSTYSTDEVGLGRLFIPNYDFSLGLPVLHPLSYLTKEIEVNGERFVPALILAELAMNNENVKEIIKNSNSFGFDYKIVNKPFGKMLKVTRLEEWILLISFSEPERCKHYIFEKLIEWHFDVFNLIEDNLAIDINTLKQ